MSKQTRIMIVAAGALVVFARAGFFQRIGYMISNWVGHMIRS